MAERMLKRDAVGAATLAGIVLLSALAVVAVSGATAGAATSTLVVDGDADGDDEYATIQAAVDASSDGDRIEVQPGTYHEAVVLNNDTTLVAPNGATLDGRGELDTGIQVGYSGPQGIANNGVAATIEGFTIENYRIGISTLDETNENFVGGKQRSHLTVRDTVVRGPGESQSYGISNAEISPMELENVTVTDFGFGINVYHDATIRNSTVSDAINRGINIDGEANGTIRDTIVRNATNGVFRWESTGQWTLRNVVVRGSKNAGMVDYRSDGTWSIRNAEIANSKAGIVNDGSGTEWSIVGSRLANNSEIAIIPSGSVGSYCGDDGGNIGGTSGDGFTVQDTVFVNNDLCFSQSGADVTIRNASFESAEIFAEESSADWTIRNSEFRDGTIRAPGASGTWSVSGTSIVGNADPVTADDVTGEWTIEESTLATGITAMGAASAVDARYNYWGSETGPGGDYNGTGAPAVGNVRVEPFYADASKTTTGTEPETPRNRVDSAVVVDATDVPAGENETVYVNATVTNERDETRDLTASLLVGSEIQDEKTVTVAGGESVSVSLWWSPGTGGNSGGAGDPEEAIVTEIADGVGFTADVQVYGSIDTSVGVNTRFPSDAEDLVATADPGIAASNLEYEWFVNGTPVDCSGETCSLSSAVKDVSSFRSYHAFENGTGTTALVYTANVSVVVVDPTGTTGRASTVVRSSHVHADKRYEGDLFYENRDDVGMLVGDEIDLSLNRDLIDHEVVDVSWSVEGAATQTRRSDGVSIELTREGKVSVDATVTLESQETGKRTERTEEVVFTVYELHESSFQHFRIDGEVGTDNHWRNVGVAIGQDRMVQDYRRLEQRVGELPETVEIELLSDQERARECGSASAVCAGDGTLHMSEYLFKDDTIQFYGARGIFRHELTHLAQDRMNEPRADGLWQFYIEGHAVYEASAEYRLNDTEIEKPTVEEMSRFESRYTEAGHFVAGVAARYGRQTMLEILRNSDGRNFRTEFQRVTGESFAEFYDDHWHPEDPRRGANAVRTMPSENRFYPQSRIEVKPMFGYEDGTLRVVRSPGTGSVSWDVDGDGTFERSGATVEWTPDRTGEHAVRVKFEKENASLAQTQRFTVESVPEGGDDEPTGDPVENADENGDGDISTPELQSSIQRWATGEISTEALQAIIRAWALSG